MQPLAIAQTNSVISPDQVVIYNGRHMPLALLPVSPLNRSFMYGDSLFESVVMRDGKIRCLDLHIKRARKGCRALQLIWSEEITAARLAPLLYELAGLNRLQGEVRFRWQIWRGDGGKFIPDSHEAHHLITVEPLPAFSVKFKHAIVSEEVKVSVSSFSGFKTGNCLPYILAGLEAKQKKADEVILLGGRFELAECISSNLFWIKGNRVYTPSLHSGCVEGIMRKRVIEWSQQKEMEVVRVRSSVRQLLLADCAFTTNVAGIHYLASVNGQQLPTPHPVVENLIQELVV